ncbi:MAG TPA: sigma-70 family RNA polymerase sigma factor [Sedimentisphaerales bacterium]|nr:sigma-70 family RNA polymerase sigma factor [Sedimentisphaerales bacterium]
MVEDEVLKWKFKCGSRDALRRIYEKYQDYLLTLAIALSNDVGAAEDILHDVFVSFAESAGTFRLRGSLRNYLATCVINRARDRIRKDRRRPAVALDEVDLLKGDSNTPDQLVICSEQSRQLAQAMAQLPYQQREVIVLRITGGMKFREIARLQNVSANTVQGRYRYGLDKLRSVLNDEVKK